jgi:hexosaminidase
MPDVCTRTNGTFRLNNNTVIYAADPALLELASYLQTTLFKYTGLTTTVAIQPATSGIQLLIDNKLVIPAGYKLEIKSSGVTIAAADLEGLFYGLNSLLQMAVLQTPLAGKEKIIQGWTIIDKPAYSWRGLMLDEARHFFGKEKVRQLLDWMAFYKLNRFHWHLTDQQGWRLAIQAYPKLALVGGIGNFSNPDAPARYYSQNDIREIVAYAAQRFITVIPEIDMPGHATAANRAYPEFSGHGSESHPDFTFHPAQESAYAYLSQILKETDCLFPSSFMHIGGDEVHYGNEQWKTDTIVRKLMADKNLADIKAVEHYFLKRMADTVARLHNKVVVWDEAVDAGLPPQNTIICWWRQNKPEQLQKALQQGFPVVLCPRLPLYFDFVQDSSHKAGRRWDAAFNSLDKVYAFDPISYLTNKRDSQLVLGMQANLWTETVTSEQRLEFLLFPRLSALAEAAWTSKPKKNFGSFTSRMEQHYRLFEREGLYYFDPRNINKYAEPVPPGKGGATQIKD